MQIKNMIQAMQLGKKKQKHHTLFTVWGEAVARKYLQVCDGKVTGIKPEAKDMEPVLADYPRPQMVRDNFTILNGVWKYAFNHTLSIPQDENWEGEILVPFSPETMLSGVSRQLQPDEYLWYEREFQIDEIPAGKRLLLHFGAVDERCRVFINGKKVGDHAGGYQAFYFDITKEIKSGSNTLNVWVKDVSDTSFHGRGKQMLNPGGMFYTAQSGIWQTVWMEWVPECYISQIKITPLYDEDSVKLEIFQEGGSLTDTVAKDMPRDCEVTIYEEGKEVASMHMEQSVVVEQKKRKVITTVLAIPDKRSWSPIVPFLYDVTIRLGQDVVRSYFGMRIFTIEKNYQGKNGICLNHVPYFQNGILDQGYWPESLMTPVCDEAMLYDIRTAKGLGFNMIRKHCKIEPMRWYYLCDKEGMIVWQDMINGGASYNLFLSCYLPTFFNKLKKSRDNFYRYPFSSRNNEKGRSEWRRDCRNTILQLYNSPCICTWVLFNEGWGQFDAQQNTEFAKKYDANRLIDSASGWFDQCSGDIKSEHVYFFDMKMEKHKRAYALSEYGGYGVVVKGHSYSENIFGYQNYETVEEFQEGYKNLWNQIEELRKDGMSAAVYTQLTDIEEEINGILTYDRKVNKLS